MRCAASGAIAGLVVITSALGFVDTVGAPVLGPSDPAGADGLFYGGGLDQLGRQVVAELAHTFGVTLLPARLVRVTIGLRVAPEVEMSGIDEAEHAESGYDLSTLGATGRGGVRAGTAGSHTPGSVTKERY